MRSPSGWPQVTVTGGLTTHLWRRPGPFLADTSLNDCHAKVAKRRLNAGYPRTKLTSSTNNSSAGDFGLSRCLRYCHHHSPSCPRCWLRGLCNTPVRNFWVPWRSAVESASPSWLFSENGTAAISSVFSPATTNRPLLFSSGWPSLEDLSPWSNTCDSKAREKTSALTEWPATRRREPYLSLGSSPPLN